MIFVVDTCVLRELFVHIKRSVFPEIWNGLEKLIECGDIVFVRETYNELALQFTKDGEVMKWLKLHKQSFQAPLNSEAAIVADIYKHRNFQNNIPKKSIVEGRPVADPFIVAKAVVCEDDCVVVTREVYSPNAARIPNICEHYGIDYIDDEEFQKILRVHGSS